MRILVLALTFVVFVFTPGQHTIAQSPEMPVPLAVVKDADGKPIAQVLDIDITSSSMVEVIFNFGGELDYFKVDLRLGRFINGNLILFFSGDNCTGNLYMDGPQQTHVALQLQKRYFIVGPDSGSGTYRVYRTTGQPWESPVIESRWNIETSSCEDTSPTQLDKYPAEEVLPNPLANFHGPTTANPERVLTIDGGTRLP